MNKLLQFFCFTFFIPCYLYAAGANKAQLLPPNETLKVLESIKSNAIIFGHGKSVIHTFIDPYCELSQRYLKFIFNKQDRMFSKYTFHFYLYELEGKDSADMITTILSSDYKETMLKTVMLDHEDIEFDDDGDAGERIDAISDAAQKIGVFKRPYILINGKVK